MKNERASVVDDDIPESSNRFFVRLKHLDVVHVALPIFDVTGMIPCHHPTFIVRPNHRSYWTVVCLHKPKSNDNSLHYEINITNYIMMIN